MNTWSINAWNFEAGFSFHFYWPSVSPVLITAPIPSIEGAVPMKWSWLFAKISSNVEFDGSGAVQLGHDVGFLIPHITIPPDNWWLIKIIALSKCKVTFARSTVFVNTHPAGAWFPILEPLLLCGEPIYIPLGQLADAAFRNTVKFTLTFGDWLRGLVYTAIDIALGWLLGKAAGALGGKFLADKLAQPLGNLLGQNLLGRIGISLNEALLEKFLGSAYGTLVKKLAGAGISLLVKGTSDSAGLGDLIYSVGVEGSPPPSRHPGQNIPNGRRRIGNRIESL